MPTWCRNWVYTRKEKSSQQNLAESAKVNDLIRLVLTQSFLRIFRSLVRERVQRDRNHAKSYESEEAAIIAQKINDSLYGPFRFWASRKHESRLVKVGVISNLTMIREKSKEGKKGEKRREKRKEKKGIRSVDNGNISETGYDLCPK